MFESDKVLENYKTEKQKTRPFLCMLSAQLKTLEVGIYAIKNITALNFKLIINFMFGRWCRTLKISNIKDSACCYFLHRAFRKEIFYTKGPLIL
eukprot:snap_masked-scaffold_22-processed-gene-1.19-mRNA-1 protein AED:1.00 eAED:1.00 QI:0/0/0/0/1/1/3/0/93